MSASAAFALRFVRCFPQETRRTGRGGEKKGGEGWEDNDLGESNFDWIRVDVAASSVLVRWDALGRRPTGEGGTGSGAVAPWVD